MHSKSVSYYSNELHDAFTGKMKVTQLCLTLCHPMDYTVHGILQARILEWVAFPFSRGSSQSRIESRSPTLQADSLPAEPPGKPKNTGVGSLSLLRCIFLTQESNQGLLHCRRILYSWATRQTPFTDLLLNLSSKVLHKPKRDNRLSGRSEIMEVKHRAKKNANQTPEMRLHSSRKKSHHYQSSLWADPDLCLQLRSLVSSPWDFSLRRNLPKSE